ncbi:MarR family transcriptional regulator [Rhodopseudomonas pseudopalustris]|uniref:Transcriptional regulator, MarR family n=2 Tax=Rhodopseudomonas TaxID=1073 RepID=Q13DQ9_RHOPS|nr:transcriptional regulator, MarR family [Rhodopseudomonas palustris BisB5]SEP23380.1 DNA-binding transcriptional regulator, MarR family [Rhodopseudomonas pseudopalustris]
MRKVGNMLGAVSIVLADEIWAAVNDTLETSGETAAALIMLGAHPGIPIKELGRALALSHSGAVRLVDRLEKEGVVRRKEGRDARTVLLHLTPAGTKLRRSVLKERARVLERALAVLSAEEVRVLGAYLDRMLRGLLTERRLGYRFCRMCEEECCVPHDCPVDAKWKELSE